MKIKLLSNDRELYRLCCEVLSAFQSGEWEVLRAHLEEPSADADFCIWDFQDDLKLPATVTAGWPRRHLFLVARKDLEVFRAKYASTGVNVLLKPVTKPMLAAFLDQMLGPQLPPASAPALNLRIERDEMLQCLIETNLKLQEYDQDRTNFLARAVHDFRAPLTALTGYCGLLLGQQLGSLTEDQREVLERMQHSAKRLSRMASGMFQLSVGGQVGNRPNLQKGDLRDCLDQALHELMPFLNEKRLSVSIDFSASPQPVYFERSQMEQVFLNLLDNACKFVPKFGFIEIRGYPYFWDRRGAVVSALEGTTDRRSREIRSANAFRLDIQDSGPGIPPEHLDRIFEEYTSYFGGQDRSGGGLGLAICKMILQQHQGRIWAENTSTGAVFSFVVPFRPAQPAPDRMTPEKSIYAEVI